MAVQIFAPPANRVTVEAALDAASPSYESVGCLLENSSWPTKETQGEETLCISDAARLTRMDPTHFTLGKFEGVVKFSETGFAALQALHAIDGTTKAFKPCLLRIKGDPTDPADTQWSVVFQGYFTNVDLDPVGDGKGILKVRFGFQVTQEPTWTFPA